MKTHAGRTPSPGSDQDLPDGYVLDPDGFDRVIIAEGCMVCNACETAAPEVFEVTADTCFVRGAARVDGITDENRTRRSRLIRDDEDLRDRLREAAEGCAVETVLLIRPADGPGAG